MTAYLTANDFNGEEGGLRYFKGSMLSAPGWYLGKRRITDSREGKWYHARDHYRRSYGPKKYIIYHRYFWLGPGPIPEDKLTFNKSSFEKGNKDTAIDYSWYMLHTHEPEGYVSAWPRWFNLTTSGSRYIEDELEEEDPSAVATDVVAADGATEEDPSAVNTSAAGIYKGGANSYLPKPKYTNFKKKYNTVIGGKRQTIKKRRSLRKKTRRRYH